MCTKILLDDIEMVYYCLNLVNFLYSFSTFFLFYFFCSLSAVLISYGPLFLTPEILAKRISSN